MYITCVRARHAEGGDRGGLWVGEGGEIDASCSLELLESVEYLFEARPDVGVLRPAIGSQASPVVRRITGEVCVCVHARAEAWRQRHRPPTCIPLLAPTQHT